jgi:stage II sporulation protein D
MGTSANAAEEIAAKLRGQGWPAFTTLWHTPAVAGTEQIGYAALPLAGQYNGILFATDLPATFAAGRDGLPLGHGGRTYRGILRVAAAGGRDLLAVVNVLDIEDYLLGVVPSEMPAGWPLEALKAQAVAARTYAVANLGKHSSRGFDLCHDVHCQAYLGLGNEYPGPTAAVRATAGIVATYGGRLINAVYHAHSGGATDSSAVIWGSSTPYLVGTSRTYEQPYHWTATNTRQEVEAIVRSALGGDVPDGLFPLLAIQPVNYTPGGRATRVNLTGPAATAQITVSKLRSGLGTYRLREAKFAAAGIWVAGLWQGPADAAAFAGLLPVISWVPGARGQGVLVSYEPLSSPTGATGSGGSATTAPGSVGLAAVDPSFIIFSGQGFGHGVGMSQWGAREMAALGMGYREILTNFYSGISLTANYGR